MILNQIDHVAIAVHDLEAAIEYYGRAFGAEVCHREKVERDAVEEALIREIKEELDYSIQVEHEFLTVEHQYPDFRLLMHSYLCTAKDVNFTLIEHIDYKWLPIHQLKHLEYLI